MDSFSLARTRKNISLLLCSKYNNNTTGLDYWQEVYKMKCISYAEKRVFNDIRGEMFGNDFP